MNKFFISILLFQCMCSGASPNASSFSGHLPTSSALYFLDENTLTGIVIDDAGQICRWLFLINEGDLRVIHRYKEDSLVLPVLPGSTAKKAVWFEGTTLYTYEDGNKKAYPVDKFPPNSFLALLPDGKSLLGDHLVNRFSFFSKFHSYFDNFCRRKYFIFDIESNKVTDQIVDDPLIMPNLGEYLALQEGYFMLDESDLRIMDGPSSHRVSLFSSSPFKRVCSIPFSEDIYTFFYGTDSSSAVVLTSKYTQEATVYSLYDVFLVSSKKGEALKAIPRETFNFFSDEDISNLAWHGRARYLLHRDSGKLVFEKATGEVKLCAEGLNDCEHITVSPSGNIVAAWGTGSHVKLYSIDTINHGENHPILKELRKIEFSVPQTE